MIARPEILGKRSSDTTCKNKTIKSTAPSCSHRQWRAVQSSRIVKYRCRRFACVMWRVQTYYSFGTSRDATCTSACALSDGAILHPSSSSKETMHRNWSERQNKEKSTYFPSSVQTVRVAGKRGFVRMRNRFEMWPTSVNRHAKWVSLVNSALAHGYWLKV